MSPAIDFGREPDTCLMFEYFLPCQILFPNSPVTIVKYIMNTTNFYILNKLCRHPIRLGESNMSLDFFYRRKFQSAVGGNIWGKFRDAKNNCNIVIFF